MLSIRAAYTPAFHGVTRSRLRTRADVGAAHSDGDTRRDSNGELWTYELGTEVPGGKIRASTNGYNYSSGSSLYSGYTTDWYSIDFFSRDSGVDAFIDAYAVANAGASKAAKATTSSGGGGGGTKKPAPSSSGGSGGKVAVKPDSVALDIASDNSWLIAIGAGVAVFLTVLIFKAPV